MKPIHFKPLNENDLPLLYAWFKKSHVKQWYARGENYTIDMIREQYLPRILHPELIPNFIVYAAIHQSDIFNFIASRIHFLME